MLTDFVVNAAQEAAQRAIENETIMRLSGEDEMRVAASLIDPPKPNEALFRARKLHIENVAVRRAGLSARRWTSIAGRQ